MGQGKIALEAIIPKMNPTMATNKFWNNWTITTRISLVISLGVIASILVIVAGAVTFLKKEYLTTFGKQQLTMVQAFALYMDADLKSKLRALTVVADVAPPEVMRDSSTAQTFLATRTGLVSLLDDGLMILTTDGRLLAETPVISQERLGKDYSSHSFFQQAQQAGRPVISEPFLSSKPGARPIVEFIAPLRDREGIVCGYLSGGLTLSGDNALGNIARRTLGNSGYFYVYSQDRTILIHHDTSRILQKDVPVGANRLFDRAVDGFDGSGDGQGRPNAVGARDAGQGRPSVASAKDGAGATGVSGVTTNARGLDVMASFQPLQAAPWILTANLPMKEVLTPFHTTQKTVIITISICGLGVILFSIWLLIRFMAPLNRFIGHIQECGEEFLSFEGKSGPEVTRLTTTFNQMLGRIQESQAEIAANEELQRTLLNASPDIIYVKDAAGRWLLANEAALALFQLQGVAFQGKNDAELAADSPFRGGALVSALSDEKAWQQDRARTTERILRLTDQEDRTFEVYKAPLFYPDGHRKAMVIIGHDITARKKNEANIRKLSQAVEQSPVTIIITDIDGNIEFVNPAFTKLTGYTFAEALGKNPNILKSDRNTPETYTQLWQTISQGKVWEGEFFNKKKNGEEFTEHAIISPIFNEYGKITHYMAIKEDITARKQSEEIIWRQANFDSLTRLPNRRSFLYRLEKTIPAAQRDNSSLVLMFLDLDYFKEVNDTLGHDLGDILLIEAAQRIRACVRETDIVSRFGGDEFVLLLTNIHLDEEIDKVSRKIINTLNQVFYLKDKEAHISASIGVTICPQDGNDVITLLKNADRAMYLAKNAGRNCWRSFADVLNEADTKKNH